MLFDSGGGGWYYVCVIFGGVQYCWQLRGGDCRWVFFYGAVAQTCVPFVEYAKEFKIGFKIKRQDILMINEPILEVENQYSKIFGSGIQIASNNFKL